MSMWRERPPEPLAPVPSIPFPPLCREALTSQFPETEGPLLAVPRTASGEES